MKFKRHIIHVILTGGTIDSYYEGTKDTAVPRKTSIIPEFITLLKLYDKLVFSQVCMKDSRELDITDLRNILNNIEKSKYNKIIITHGTYTMPNTARFLKANLKRKDQTIILTGSMIPLQGFAPSDGGFNLGYSFAKVKDLPPGIYICMNSRIFEPTEVLKLIKSGRFYSIFGEK